MSNIIIRKLKVKKKLFEFQDYTYDLLNGLIMNFFL
jgi:hypothetical protein